MPVVPVYNNLTSQLNPTPNVGVRAPDIPDVAGTQAQALGQAATRTGDAISRIALDAQQQANQVRVNDAMNKAVEAKLRLTYDPNEGFIHLKGDAALTRPDGQSLDNEYVQKLGTQLGEIESSLGNDAQKLAFQQQSRELVTQFRGLINKHVSREYGDYQNSVQDGTIKTAGAQMALSWGDPDAVAQGSNAIKAAVAEKGRLQGWSGQETEANMMTALSPAHAAVIGAAVDAGKLDYAREYFNQVSPELTPVARLQIQKTLDQGDFETRTQNKADELFAKYPDDPASALREARETMSGKDEDAVVQRIQRLDAERVTLRERVHKDAADAAWRVYASTGSMSAIPPSTISAMDGRDLEALRRTAKTDFEAAQAQKEPKTDPNVYYGLSRLSTSPDFANVDLRQYFSALSPGDRKHFMDLQTKITNPDDVSQVVSVEAQKSAMVKSLGLKDQQAGMFYQVADQELNAAQTAKGRKLTQDERQQVLDRLVIQGSVPAQHWYTFGSNMGYYEAINSGQANQFVPKWSDADVRKATAALQRRGVANPTQDQINAVIRGAYGAK